MVYFGRHNRKKKKMIQPTSFDSWIPVIAIGLFALVHAGFQLGVSVLTLLSGHSLGKSRSLQRTLGLNIAYIVGVVMITGLLLSLCLFIWEYVYYWPAQAVLAGLATACVFLGLLVIVTYYRRGHGTSLWIPRSLADYLMQRAKHTKNTVESAVLGATTVVAELPFTIVVIAGSTYILQLFVGSRDLPNSIVLYSLAVAMPLMIVTILLAGGHPLSHIQRWRESNKVFLQSASAYGLFVVALFITVFYLGDFS